MGDAYPQFFGKKNNIRSVIRRYLQRHKFIFNRNQVIEGNLNGSNLSFNEAKLCQTDLHELIVLTNGKKLVEENTNTKGDRQQNKSYLKNIINWNGLDLNSQAEVKIAEALDRANIIFFSNTKIRLTTATGRENKIVNFVILHRGKLGIIQKRYKFTFNRNQIIGVNLSGANLSFNEANLCQTDLQDLILVTNSKN